jgi:hypothetical protein
MVLRPTYMDEAHLESMSFEGWLGIDDPVLPIKRAQEDGQKVFNRNSAM